MMPFIHKNAMNYHGCLQILFMILQEKVIEPDDIIDGNGHGAWKKGIYGDPFDYTRKKLKKVY